MTIRLVTVVWLHRSVRAFSRIAIRGLLAEGNALDLARAHRGVFGVVVTTGEELGIR